MNLIPDWRLAQRRSAHLPAWLTQKEVEERDGGSLGSVAGNDPGQRRPPCPNLGPRTPLARRHPAARRACRRTTGDAVHDADDRTPGVYHPVRRGPQDAQHQDDGADDLCLVGPVRASDPVKSPRPVTTQIPSSGVSRIKFALRGPARRLRNAPRRRAGLPTDHMNARRRDGLFRSLSALISTWR